MNDDDRLLADLERELEPDPERFVVEVFQVMFPEEVEGGGGIRPIYFLHDRNEDTYSPVGETPEQGFAMREMVKAFSPAGLVWAPLIAFGIDPL